MLYVANNRFVGGQAASKYSFVIHEKHSSSSQGYDAPGYVEHEHFVVISDDAKLQANPFNGLLGGIYIYIFYLL